jgi:hypothetical protein
MKRLVGLTIPLAALTAAACSQERIAEQMSSPEDRALASVAIKDVAQGDAADLATRMPAEARPQLASALPRMRAALPPRIEQTKLVDARWAKFAAVSGPAATRSFLAYQIQGDGRYSLAQISILRQGGYAEITDFYINRLDRPIEELTEFSLTGKTSVHYAMLFAAVAAVGVTIAALWRIWRSGRFRRRWLWTLGALLGLARLSIDWTTGQLFFVPLFIQVFSAGAFRTGINPWVISVSVPVVAIIVLLRHRSGRGAEREIAQA